MCAAMVGCGIGGPIVTTEHIEPMYPADVRFERARGSVSTATLSYSKDSVTETDRRFRKVTTKSNWNESTSRAASDDHSGSKWSVATVGLEHKDGLDCWDLEVTSEQTQDGLTTARTWTVTVPFDGESESMVYEDKDIRILIEPRSDEWGSL